MSFLHLIVGKFVLLTAFSSVGKGTGPFKFDVVVKKERTNSISGQVIVSVMNMRDASAISLNVRSENNCFKIVSGFKNVSSVSKKKGELFRRKINYKLYNIGELCSMIVDVDAVDSKNNKQSITKVAELNEAP